MSKPLGGGAARLAVAASAAAAAARPVRRLVVIPLLPRRPGGVREARQRSTRPRRCGGRRAACKLSAALASWEILMALRRWLSLLAAVVVVAVGGFLGLGVRPMPPDVPGRIV